MSNTVSISETPVIVEVVGAAGTTEVIRSVAASVEVVTAGPKGQTGDAGAPGPPKALTVAPPKPGDEFTLFYTQYPTTLTQVLAIVRGTSPGVQFELRYGPDRSAAGTLAVVPENVTNTTTGEAVAIQNMPIPADNFLWVKVTAVTGVVQELNVSVEI